jgi:hypothetical protein
MEPGVVLLCVRVRGRVAVRRWRGEEPQGGVCVCVCVCVCVGGGGACQGASCYLLLMRVLHGTFGRGLRGQHHVCRGLP